MKIKNFGNRSYVDLDRKTYFRIKKEMGEPRFIHTASSSGKLIFHNEWYILGTANIAGAGRGWVISTSEKEFKKFLKKYNLI